MPSAEGVPARRAALQMLDAVLRRGLTIEGAGQQVRGLSPPDHALAVAITGETLRRLPDFDALIDSATRQRLPDDSKARTVLRLALAQKIGLGTPDHALVATALPLVDGGPRRLVHGVLGTLLRRGVTSVEAPRLPDDVEGRWGAAWGNAAVAAAGHKATSLDASKSRLERLSENLSRTQLAADLIRADALAWKPQRPFDAILLDAPCSATGTFRRHPEVLYRARAQIIAENAE